MRACLCILLFGWLCAAAIASLPFVDNFDNGLPENSDTIAGFWTTILATPGGSEVTEDVGPVLSSIHLFGKPEVHLVGTSVSPDFNFFSSEVTFQVSGLVFTAIPSTDPTNQVFRFAVQSESGTTQFGADDAITLFIDAANHIRLGFKLNGNGNADTAHQLVNAAVISGGAITAFSLTLNDKGYALRVTLSSGAWASFRGAYTDSLAPLPALDWGFTGAKGDSTMSLQALNTSGNGGIVEVSIDRLFVLPSPSIRSIGILDTNVLLTFSAVSNALYDVQKRDDLVSDSWSTIASNITATGSVGTHLDLGAASLPKRFHRVELQPN